MQIKCNMILKDRNMLTGYVWNERDKGAYNRNENSKKLISKAQMIEIEIQEWQELKAKLSQLAQELIFLKNQNYQLKEENYQLKEENYQLKEENYQLKEENCQLKEENCQLKTHLNHPSLINSLSSNDKSSVSSQPQKHVSLQSIQKHPQSDMLMLESNESRNCPQIISNYKPYFNYSEQAQSDHKPTEDKNTTMPADQNQKQSTCLQSALHQGTSKNQQYPTSITVTRKSHTPIQLPKILSSQPTPNITNPNDQLHLIQQICVFGPSLTLQNLHQVTFKNDHKQFLPPSLYYPQNQSSYQHYGNYLFPKNCRVKPTQKSHITIQANKIIFKTSKKTPCNIFIFQPNSNLHPIHKPHQILQTTNPSKWLYGLTIEFNDFAFQQLRPKDTTLKKCGSQEELDEMYEMQSPTVSREKRSSLLELNVKGFLEQQIRMESVSLKDIELENQTTRMYRSTFCLCIFTYFPFVAYLQSIISAIFDEVKLKRIEHFPETGEFKDCDINYFIKEVDVIAKRIKEYLNFRPVSLGRELTLKVNESELQIELSEEEMEKELYWNWAVRVISLMEREVLYEIYSMVMLEESVMFVCEDEKLLSFIVLLFASMLTKPFSYPYPVVSILFSEELLQTPFTSIVGVNQSEAWLWQAIEDGSIDAKHKQIIMVNEKEIKIRRRQGFALPKSQSLKKIFSKIGKKCQPSSLSSILLGKDSLLRKTSLPVTPDPNPNESNEQVLAFIAKLQMFYHENVFAHIPNTVRLDIKEAKDNEAEFNKVSMRNQTLNEIQKTYKSSNPDFVKDEFLKKFIQTQIFSIYLIEEYSLDS